MAVEPPAPTSDRSENMDWAPAATSTRQASFRRMISKAHTDQKMWPGLTGIWLKGEVSHGAGPWIGLYSTCHEVSRILEIEIFQ